VVEEAAPEGGSARHVGVGMTMLHRRQLLTGLGGLALATPAWARTGSVGLPPPRATLSGADIKLTIGHGRHPIDGRTGHVVCINGTTPGPLLRLRQGQTVRLAVENTLAEDTSLHWHGLLAPPQFDGVPGVSYPGIKPGQTFLHEFPLIQSGTYWYHSHSGLQEPEGCYGPIVIDPEGEDPVRSEREHVIVLSDYSFMHPHLIMKRMKQQAGFFNDQKQTLAGLLAGRDQTLAERIDWAKMLMDPTDISDITGTTYTYLVNGHGPKDNWTGLFRPGERVRLRLVNAAAQTIFNVRLPGLLMTVVAADGQNVRPVAVDELQIANAETFDVVVRPLDDRAYTLVAEAVDRSGMARATLAPRLGMSAEVPPLRERPRARMKDMGMGMGDTDRAAPMPMAGMDHAAMGHDVAAMGSGAASKTAPGMAPPPKRGVDTMAAMDGMGAMDMSMRNPDNAPQVRLSPTVQTLAPMPSDRTGEPGQGLGSVGHRVLVYQDLVALESNPDTRAPSRTMEIHLTGNMERFSWGFDGEAFSDRTTKPYAFREGERVRVTLVNDTMMAHPIHLHGHFFELTHGPAGHLPRKHTVNVLPGGTVTFDLTTDAVGDWAFHCHMLYHMHAGMFRVVTVRPAEGAA
jgi:CopA family copper-resistance protein